MGGAEGSGVDDGADFLTLCASQHIKITRVEFQRKSKL